jgi:tetratricopeptide (TPR) repeat protein
MKMKMFVAALFLSLGASSAIAQECNANSSLSHEAVRVGNFKDAYEPCMAVLKECPTLKYYTYTDAKKILRGLMAEIKDRKNADYQKYFNELLGVYDLQIQYLPELNKKLKADQQVSSAELLGDKAVDYLQFAPSVDLNQVYAWLKESVDGDKGASKGATLNAFLDISTKKVQADKNHTGQYFQDYMDATKYIDEAIANETKANTKAYLEALKNNFTPMFVSSGVADCESLQTIYGPQIEENKGDSVVLQKAINVLKLMRCTESDAYFAASDYMYRIRPTADAAIGVGYMYIKKEEYEKALPYIDEALTMETDNAKKAEMAYLAAASLSAAKKYSQARKYCYDALKYNENYGNAYILLANLYASSPNWSNEGALNRCTYFVCIDKLQRAKSVDPSVAEKANELIASYSRYTPEAKDLFMLGYKPGDRVTVGGWIGESTTIR